MMKDKGEGKDDDDAGEDEENLDDDEIENDVFDQQRE